MLALYTAAWLALAIRAEGEIMAELQEQRRHGLDIASGIHSLSGFPFALQVRLRDFAAHDSAGLTFEAPVMVVGASLFTRSRATISAPDGGMLTIESGHVRGMVKAAIATADGTIGFAGTGVGTADLTLHTVSVAGLSQGDGTASADEMAIQVRKPPTPPADHRQPGFQATVKIAGMNLPDFEPVSRGKIKELQFDAVVMGQLPSLDESTLKAWRDDGGVLELRRFSLIWDGVTVKGDGTLALDNDLQPVGSFAMTVTGYDEALSVLVQQHVIKQTSAGLLSIALGLIARPEGIEATPTLHVPLSIQNREIYLSSFKLADMPVVRLY